MDIEWFRNLAIVIAGFAVIGLLILIAATGLSLYRSIRPTIKSIRSISSTIKSISAWDEKSKASDSGHRSGSEKEFAKK